MAKQLGRALLVKIGDGGGPETFSNLCGLNSKSLTLNNNAIDVTTPDCTTQKGRFGRKPLRASRTSQFQAMVSSKTAPPKRG